LLPIFTLESQEWRLFGPLAFTKTFSTAAALLSVTLVPALMVIFRGRIIPEHRNPINNFLVFAVLNGTVALVRPNTASPGHRADLGL
jgi:copper/silver efflux system protein